MTKLEHTLHTDTSLNTPSLATNQTAHTIRLLLLITLPANRLVVPRSALGVAAEVVSFGSPLGTTVPLPRAMSASTCMASSLRPLTRSHLGDSGMTLVGKKKRGGWEGREGRREGRRGREGEEGRGRIRIRKGEGRD